MIGSKNKVAKTKEALYKSGFRPAEVEAIHAPIGLKIGAVTPEEIAVCIAAEIIQEKNKMPVETIEDAVLDALCEDTGSTMALIVAKSGSTPREAGARMAVKGNEILAGTIGGGAVEPAAIDLRLSDAEASYPKRCAGICAAKGRGRKTGYGMRRQQFGVF